MRRAAPILLLAASLLLFAPADAGHELPIYPSYYPQEIRIEVVDPAQAVSPLRTAAIHAYVGSLDAVEGKPPEPLVAVESLGSYVVLTFGPGARRPEQEEARCRAAGALVRTAAARGGRLVLHPYPITPYHADYLQHADLAAQARRRLVSAAAAAAAAAPRVRARGRLAEALAPPAAGGAGPEATLEEIPLEDLLAPHRLLLNGWLGPPWLKEGWFHAFLLLEGTLADPRARETARSLVGRLERGEYGSPEEKLGLERALVTRLRQGCERVVLGYTVRREYFNAEYSAGVENIAYDSHAGFNSGLFLRTVKLKDFPWNGWLRLGIATPPAAAWNPVGGFTDPAGRLIWHVLGDPAVLPNPYATGWVLNRIADARPAPAK